MARIEVNRGTQLDTNYYHYLNVGLLNPVTTNGYFTGSGLAQRFIDKNGEMSASTKPPSSGLMSGSATST